MKLKEKTIRAAQYLGVAITLSLSSGYILGLSNGGYKRITEPLRIAPTLQDIIAYRLDEYENRRHFIDAIPFGSLDAVIIIRDDERIEIKPDSLEFAEQEKVYNKKIRQLYIK
ncbi:MAG: hypothetical protein AABW52_05115 [Nanoarchaeota archaeon]